MSTLEEIRRQFSEFKECSKPFEFEHEKNINKNNIANKPCYIRNFPLDNILVREIRGCVEKYIGRLKTLDILKEIERDVLYLLRQQHNNPGVEYKCEAEFDIIIIYVYLNGEFNNSISVKI